MSKLYFFLCIYTISASSLNAAAEEKQPEIPTYIELSIPVVSGNELVVKIRLSKREQLTGKTFAKLTQESFRSGMPLALATSLCKSPLGFSTETVDLRALFHAHASWRVEEMTEGDKITLRLREAMDSYASKYGSDTACVFDVKLVGPLYMRMRNMQLAEYPPVSIYGREEIFKNHNLVSLLIIYAEIKDPELKKHVLRMFSSIYVAMLKEEKDEDVRRQLSDCHQKLLAYWAGSRKTGLIKHYKSL